MKPETRQMLLKIFNHPLYHAANYATIGAGVGGLTSSILTRMNNKEMTEIMTSKNDLIPTKEYVAQYDPTASVLSSHADVDKSKEYNALENFILKRMIPKDDLPWKNYYNNPERNLVIAPEMSNKYLLGHELGHAKDLKDNPPIPYPGAETVRSLTGELTNIEERAWNKSPIEMDEEGERVKRVAITPYNNLQKYIRIGFGLGALAGAGKSFGPKILELIRSGNVR